MRDAEYPGNFFVVITFQQVKAEHGPVTIRQLLDCIFYFVYPEFDLRFIDVFLLRNFIRAGGPDLYQFNRMIPQVGDALVNHNLLQPCSKS